MLALGCSHWSVYFGVLELGRPLQGAQVKVLMLGYLHWDAHFGMLTWGCLH